MKVAGFTDSEEGDILPTPEAREAAIDFLLESKLREQGTKNVDFAGKVSLEGSFTVGQNISNW